MASADPEPEKKPRQRRRQKPPDDTQSRVQGEVVTTKTEGVPAPIDHVLKATTRHIKSLDRERRQLLANIEQLQKALDEARTELAQTRPELATARANLRNMEWAALNASIFVAISGSAVSAAGYFDDRFRRPVLFAGVAMLICGLMLQFRLGRRSKA
jgi:hypothetical protein